MITNEPSPPETVEVKQVDRDAAAGWWRQHLSRDGDGYDLATAFARHRTTAESASCEVSEEVVERVAKAIFDASPYSDGSPWDHVSMRRYEGTSSAREFYLTAARAAIAAVSGGVTSLG